MPQRLAASQCLRSQCRLGDRCELVLAGFRGFGKRGGKGIIVAAQAATGKGSKGVRAKSRKMKGPRKNPASLRPTGQDGEARV